MKLLKVFELERNIETLCKYFYREIYLQLEEIDQKSTKLKKLQPLLLKMSKIEDSHSLIWREAIKEPEFAKKEFENESFFSDLKNKQSNIQLIINNFQLGESDETILKNVYEAINTVEDRAEEALTYTVHFLPEEVQDFINTLYRKVDYDQTHDDILKKINDIIAE